MKKRIVYLNKERDIVTAEQAKWVVETELGDNDEVLKETWVEVTSISDIPIDDGQIDGLGFSRHSLVGFLSLVCACLWLIFGGNPAIGIILMLIGIFLNLRNILNLFKKKGS